MIVLDTHKECREFSEARKIATASEKNKTFRLVNNSICNIEKWKIDNCVLKNETACDFLFLLSSNGEFENAFWIELKSSDIEQAAFQILATIKKIEIEKGVIHHARIIPSRNPNPRFRASDYRKLENFIREGGGTMKNQNKLLEEII